MNRKDRNRIKFERTRRRQDHAHKGSCNHKSILGLDKLTERNHDLMIERQAARLGADGEEE